MSGVSAIVAVTPAYDAPSPETSILTATMVQFELPEAAETERPRPPAVERPAARVAGEMVREEYLAQPPAEDPAAAAKPEAVLKLDWQTDLTQIETNPAKQRERVQEVAAEVIPPRPKRVRQPLAPLDQAPLVQIETQRAGPAVTEHADLAGAGSAPTAVPSASHPV
jgi:ribonuclease E